MIKQFETERFDLVKADKVRIANYKLEHNRQGERDVWIESGEKGERFSSQIIDQGEPLAVRDIFDEVLHPARKGDRPVLVFGYERLRLLAA